MSRIMRTRRGTVIIAIMWLASIVVIVPLAAILVYLVVSGGSALSFAFVTHMPSPAGVEGGGMGNAIAGTLVLIGIGSAIGIPIGIGAGLFVAEQSTTSLAKTVRFLADVLSGLPSIVIGIFVWQLVVRPIGQFSAIAGGVALGCLIIPLVTRATEEMVLLVPTALTEAALALGFPRWRASVVVVLRTAMPGIITAVLVAVARAAGETAPLLFTALGNAYWSLDLLRPIAALPLQIFAYAQSPYDDWRAQASAGALVLVALVAVMSLVARAVVRSRHAQLRTSRVGSDDTPNDLHG